MLVTLQDCNNSNNKSSCVLVTLQDCNNSNNKSVAVCLSRYMTVIIVTTRV